MRKRTLNCLFDNVMWYLLYMLPLLAFLILLFQTGTPQTLSTCISSLGLNVLSDNIILVGLTDLFGASGVFPLFVSADILIYFAYFISMWLCHIAVDVLLFLVRWAHSLMSSFGGDK